jgi:hypothetical protein
MRSAFSVVVADVCGDTEGEADSGSIEVEERNHMAERPSPQRTLSWLSARRV